MAKVIRYQIGAFANVGTEDAPDFQPIINYAEIVCATQAIFDANYPIAEREALDGTIEISGEFDPEPQPNAATADDVLNALLGVNRYA